MMLWGLLGVVIACSPDDVASIARAGDVECATRLAATLDPKQLNLLITEAELALRSLARFEQQQEPASSPTVVVQPAVEWAQSPDTVLLRVKWAHKLDAPATLDVNDVTLDCKDKSLVLAASAPAKRFELQLDLAFEVTECRWDPGSVGRIVVTLDKKDKATRWPRLTDDALALHTWFDRQDDYDLDELPEPTGSSSKKKKKKNATKKSAAAKGEEDEEPLVEGEAPRGNESEPRADDADRPWWRDFVENWKDGWTGDLESFAARQADRALASVRRNASRHNAPLDAEAFARKSKINSALQISLSHLESTDDTPEFLSYLHDDDQVAEEEETDDAADL